MKGAPPPALFLLFFLPLGSTIEAAASARATTSSATRTGTNSGCASATAWNFSTAGATSSITASIVVQGPPPPWAPVPWFGSGDSLLLSGTN